MTIEQQQKLVNQAQQLGFNLSALYRSTPWTQLGSTLIVRIHTKATKRYLRRLKQLEQLQNPLEDLTVNCATCKLSALDCVSCTLVEPITHLTYLPYLQNSAELAPPLDSAEHNQEATLSTQAQTLRSDCLALLHRIDQREHEERLGG